MVWKAAGLLLVVLLTACGSDNDSTVIGAPSTVASANNATDRESLPGSGTGDGTGSDATTGSLESTTVPETENEGEAATATTTDGADKGDPNVTVISLGALPDQSLFTMGVMSAPANQELQIVFSNPSDKPHNWVLVEPGQEQAVADAAASGTELSQIDGVIAWSETVTDADTRINVPPLEQGGYPYISTVPGDFPNMKGALNVR